MIQIGSALSSPTTRGTRDRLTIHETAALAGPTVTRNPLRLVVFERELVIVAKLFATSNIALRINDDSLASVERDDFGDTIWTATRIDEPGDVALFRRIANVQGVDSEHVVTSNLCRFVLLFSLFSHGVPNQFTSVLDNHLARGNIFVCKHSPSMNTTAIEA